MTTDREIARWRLRSQHLVLLHAASAAAVIRDLLAVQAENPGQAEWAVASRVQKVPIHDAAHGFVPGRSIVTNAAPRRPATWS